MLNALQNERDLCWGTTSGFSSSPVSQIAALFHISGLTALERACWSTAFFSIWHQYVEALPPSWFAREAEPVLAELGETVVLSRRIGAELSKMKSLARTTSFDRFTELTRLKIQYSEVIGRLSTKLRLTNQSRMSERQAANDAQRSTIKPWDIGTDTDSPADRADEPVNWDPR